MENDYTPMGGDDDAVELFDGPAANPDDAARLRYEDRLYAEAEREKQEHWFGMSLGTATVLTETLDAHFDGRGGHPAQIESRPSPGGDPVDLRREDIVSLLGGHWVEANTVRAALMTRFPDGVTGQDGVYLADPAKIDQCFALNEAVTDPTFATFDGLDLSDACYKNVSAMNETNQHFVGFWADKTLQQIEVVDSWVHPDAGAQAERKLRLESMLTGLFNWACGLPTAHQSWAECFQKWKFAYRLGYQQLNSDDCGLHAIQNAVDSAIAGQLQMYHDAQVQRYRTAVRLQRVLDGRYTWGTDLPFEAELRTKWASIANAGPPAIHDQPAAVTPQQQIANAVAMVTNGTAQARLEHQNLAGSVVPFNITVSYKNAVAAIVSAAGPSGLSIGEIKDRYARYSSLLGRKLPANWRGALDKAINRREGLFLQPHDTIDGNFRLAPMAAEFADESSVMWYGSGMNQHIAKLPEIADDISTRPDLLIVPARVSIAGGGINSNKVPNLGDDMTHASNATLDFWMAVHNQRPIDDEPAKIEIPEDMSNEHTWSYHIYSMTLRSSRCRVFERDNGSQGPDDIACFGILQELNNRARAQGVRKLATFLVAGVDAWTLHLPSLMELPAIFDALDLRLTMLLPATTVGENFSYLFTTRHHEDQNPDFSWAHFDLGIVADIYQQLQTDRKAAIQWQRFDQTALIHVLNEVGHWKLEEYYCGGRELGTDDDAGSALLRGYQRNHLGLRRIDKKCCECESSPEDSEWRRGPQNQADVMCPDCFSNLEDGAVAEEAQALPGGETASTNVAASFNAGSIPEKTQTPRRVPSKKRLASAASPDEPPPKVRKPDKRSSPSEIEERRSRLAQLVKAKPDITGPAAARELNVNRHVVRSDAKALKITLGTGYTRGGQSTYERMDKVHVRQQEVKDLLKKYPTSSNAAIGRRLGVCRSVIRHDRVALGLPRSLVKGDKATLGLPSATTAINAGAGGDADGDGDSSSAEEDDEE